MTKKYTVIARPTDETEPGAFDGINLGKGGYAEFQGWEGDNAIYVVYTKHNIDPELDRSNPVISYSKDEVDLTLQDSSPVL